MKEKLWVWEMGIGYVQDYGYVHGVNGMGNGDGCEEQ